MKIWGGRHVVFFIQKINYLNESFIFFEDFVLHVISGLYVRWP